MTLAKFGQSLRRVEDHKFLTGQGCYVDDISLPGMVHAVVVYSRHAHARIKAIDARRALQSPGVLAVLTGAHVAGRLGPLPPLFMPEDSGGPKGYRTMRPLLCEHTVRHVGDRVAFCVADTVEQARDAADLIDISYETLPSVVSLADATTSRSAVVWDAAPTNVCFTLTIGDAASTEKAFASAAHCVKLSSHQFSDPGKSDGAARSHRRLQPIRRRIRALLQYTKSTPHS